MYSPTPDLKVSLQHYELVRTWSTVLVEDLLWEKREVCVFTILILDSTGMTAVMAVTAPGRVLCI